MCNYYELEKALNELFSMELAPGDIYIDSNGEIQLSERGKEIVERTHKADVIKTMASIYQDEVSNQIKDIIEESGVTEDPEAGPIDIDTPIAKIRYVPARVSRRFDSNAFKRDHPEYADEYTKETPTKSSLRWNYDE